MTKNKENCNIKVHIFGLKCAILDLSRRSRTARANRLTRDERNSGDCIVADKFDFHKLSADLSEIQDKKLRKHIENAVKFTRKREPVLQANSSRTSSRPECAQCGVGIRKETTPVNGMHPKCAKVASDASFAAQMPISSHAARSVHDRKILP